MDEIWKPVVGHEGLYEVSSLGRVRSLDREVVFRDGRTRKFAGVNLKSSIDSVGYPRVRLVKNLKGVTRRVHELVVPAFQGPKPTPKHCVRHLNDVKTDNRLENLAWGTPKQNQQDKYLNGYRPERPTKCKRGHEFNGENTKVKPDGRRNCKTCAKAYSAILYKNGKVTEEMYDQYFKARGI